MSKTPNQLAAELMSDVCRLIPGDSDENHDARCRVALAIHAGEDVNAALAREGVE